MVRLAVPVAMAPCFELVVLGLTLRDCKQEVCRSLRLGFVLIVMCIRHAATNRAVMPTVTPPVPV